MPYDPTKPANGTPASSAEMRAQFTALKALIDAIPTGPAGPAGAPGEITQATLDSAVAGTPRNPTSVQPLNIGTTDPTITALMDKLNELIAALVR